MYHKPCGSIRQSVPGAYLIGCMVVHEIDRRGACDNGKRQVSSLKQNAIMYYRADEAFSPEAFGSQLARLVSEIRREKCKERVLYLCIGSDRSTGDSLGPLIGHMLTCKDRRYPHGRHREPDMLLKQNGVYGYGCPDVLGTLRQPVHAVNLEEIIELIEQEYGDAVVVAIDASIGSREHVGCITLSKGAMKPGLGVSKDLTAVGHISITGIVGSQGRFEPLILQNTRLSVVMELADCICRGIETVGFLSKTFLPPQTENDSLRIRPVV